MAYIAHRCTRCSHLESGHFANGEHGRCQQTHTCPCAGWVSGPPVLVPTYGLRGRTLDTITPPGKPVTAGIAACGCDDCQTLHTKLTEEAA